MTATRVWPGSSSPLGATLKGSGVNFALFSEHATKVELCLFDSPDAKLESQRIALGQKTNQVWHGCLPDVKPGQVYGYRVHGPHVLGEKAYRSRQKSGRLNAQDVKRRQTRRRVHQYDLSPIGCSSQRR